MLTLVGCGLIALLLSYVIEALNNIAKAIRETRK
jgi:hypothetical protein